MYSVDTWVSLNYNMDMQTGLHRYVCHKRDKVGTSSYNWENGRNSFDWWKKRFQQMSNYFDTFRIDHILGFFPYLANSDRTRGGIIMGYLNPSVPIHIDEFYQRDSFDYNRFCLPYITDSVIWENFGDDANWVKINCIDIIDGWIGFKPICNKSFGNV